MNTGTILPSEKRNYRDPDTGRTVTVWTQSTADDIGLYYHQNAFDARRGFVYFVSNRSGTFQIWRADRRDGRLTQVSDFDGFGEQCHGVNDAGSSYNYVVYVSKRSGRIFAAGRQQYFVIDPDSLRVNVIRDGRVAQRHPDLRYLRDGYVFPSCDDRWVYGYSVFASDNEFAAVNQMSLAVTAAYQKTGLATHTATYPHAPHGMLESPLEHVIFRIEVATGTFEELWRGHWWIQHVQASPTDPDLVTFIWASMRRTKPKYFLLRAGGQPQVLLHENENFAVFHDFWHPDGTKWYAHSCENMHPGEGYAPIPGKMKFYVCEIGIADLANCAIPPYKRWYETAGESHVHLHLNIAPDGSFLVGDGQSDCPWIGRLDWQPDGTLQSSRLCRVGYWTANARHHGCETSPNVQVTPDGREVFFNTYRDNRCCLASVGCA